MKKIMMFLLLLVATMSFGQVLTENFDGVTAPAVPTGWTILNENGDAKLWVTATGGTTGNAMKIGYNSSVAMDDWAITPSLALTAGTAYQVTFNYKAAGFTELLAVHMGTDITAASMGSALLDLSNSSSTYQEGSVNFTPSTTGNYYLGFHGHSDADMYNLYFDDVVVKEAPADPIFAITPETYAFVKTPVAQTSVASEFVISNTGGGTLTIADGGITLIGTNADQFALDLSGIAFPLDLAAGEKDTIALTFTPTSIGVKNAQIQIVDNVTKATNTVDISGEGFVGIAEGFEGDTFPPAGWYIMTNTTADGGLNGANLVAPGTDTWFHCSPASFSGEGATYIHTGGFSAALGYTAPDFEWLTTPNLQLGVTPSLSFWLWYYQNATYSTNFNVVVYDDAAATWNSVLNYTTGTPINKYDSEVTIDLSAYANKLVKIAFVYEFTDGYQAAIDDIAIINSGVSGIADNNIVKSNVLYQNYPNPFNPETTINFNLEKQSNISLNIYNTSGQLVSSLVNGSFKAGMHTVNFNATNLTSGVYYYTLKSGNMNVTKKMLLVK